MDESKRNFFGPQVKYDVKYIFSDFKLFYKLDNKFMNLFLPCPYND